jgi:chromosome segregation ATPase
MAIESTQTLLDRIKFIEDGVHEVHRLTGQIDELKKTLQTQRTKISELNRALLGYESFNHFDDERLSQLKKHRQELEHNPSKPSKKSRRRTQNLETVECEINQIQIHSNQIKTDHMKCREETRATKEKASSTEAELSHLTGLREDLFVKILGSSRAREP